MFSPCSREALMTYNWIFPLLITGFLGYAWRAYRRSLLMPPGPRGLPLLGNALQMPASMPWLKFTEWSEQYGPIFSLNIAGQPIIVLNTYKAASALLDARSNIYSDRPRLIVPGKMLTGGVSVAFTPYGSLLRKLRKAAHLGFNQHAVTSYRATQAKEAQYTALDLLKFPGRWTDHIKRLPASSILSTLYGWDMVLGHDAPDIQAAYAMANRITKAAAPGAYLVELIPVLQYMPVWTAAWKRDALEWYSQQTMRLKEYIKGVKIQKDKGNLEPCFIGELLDKQDQHDLTETEIAWLPGVMSFAGAETTTTTLMYFILAMVLYPEAMRSAQEELDHVIGRERPPSPNDIEHLPYIQAMVKELMRWRPAGPMGVPHRVTEVSGLWYYPSIRSFLKEDAIRMIGMRDTLFPRERPSFPMSGEWAMHRDPVIYPNFDKFLPERHLSDSKPEGADPLGHSTFGFGRRICVGMHYATQSLEITVATILWAVNIEPELDRTGKPMLPSQTDFVDYGITVGPKLFQCRIIPRFPNARAILESIFRGDQ